MTNREKARKILFEVYREGFEAISAKRDKHDFDVVEEALKQIWKCAKEDVKKELWMTLWGKIYKGG